MRFWKDMTFQEKVEFQDRCRECLDDNKSYIAEQTKERRNEII